MLLYIAVAIWALCSLVALFNARKSDDYDTFWGIIIAGGCLVGMIFAFLLPMVATSQTLQYDIPVDNGKVYKTDDLNGGTQYYIISDGQKESINDLGTGIAFDIGTDNTAEYYCEQVPSWVAPYTIDEQCWWYVNAESSGG